MAKRRVPKSLPPGVRVKLLADGQPLYEAKVYFPDGQGGRAARYAYAHTLEELAIAKADLLKQRRTAPRRKRVREDDPMRMTVAQLAERWVDRHVVKLADGTDDYYRIALTYRIAPYLYDRKIGALSRREVEEWMTDLLLEPLRDERGHIVCDEEGEVVRRHGPRSINAALSTLKAMYGKAVDWELVEVNPCQRVKMLDEHEKAIRIYEPGEVERIVKQIRKARAAQVHGGRGSMNRERAGRLAARDSTMVKVLAYCGLRLGELAGLQVKHYDDGRERDSDGKVIRDRGLGWLVVEQQVEGRTGKIKATKGKKSRRVPALRTVRNAIDEYLAEMPRREDDAYLFPSMQSPKPERWGYLKHGKWRDNIFSPAARDAGFPDAIPHELRHTFASLIIEHGQGKVSNLRLAGWMGHKGTRLIDERYGHIFDRVETEMLHDVDAAIFATPSVADDVAAGASAHPAAASEGAAGDV